MDAGICSKVLKEDFVMKTINMLSGAALVKGQGVLSAYLEQVELVRHELGNDFSVCVNQPYGCDVMHYHTINLGYFLTLPFAKMRGKTVGYVHFLPETLEKSIRLPRLIKPLFYRYVVRFYKSMDYLVTVNPDFVERIEKYGVPRDRIKYIPNFVSPDRFYPMTGEQRMAEKRRLGIAQDRFTVLCVGQIQKAKGFFDFIEAARRMPQAQFVWGGGFAFGVISEDYRAIKEIVENPPNNVLFTGLVEREDMCGLYNAADVLFLPSYGELFPMTVLEAMNCGIPLLLRDLDNYGNILFDFYLKASNIDGFLSVLRALERDREYYQMAAEHSLRGAALYSRERVAQMWKNFYCEVMESGAVPVRTARAMKRLAAGHQNV